MRRSDAQSSVTRELRYIAGLDLLRFLGALSVIGLHLGSLAMFKEAGLSRLHVLVSGGTGVTLFYVISGYLITSLIAQEVRHSGTFDIKGFFLRRSLRIFPLYYFALALYMACHLLGIQKMGGASFLYAAAYSYNFIPTRLYDGWLGSFHTLATEEHFYLVYPLLWGLCLWRRWPMWIVLVTLFALTFITPALCQSFRSDYSVGRWTFNAWGPILIGGIFAELRIMAGDRHQGRQYFLAVFALLFASQALVANAFILRIAFGFLILHLACNQNSPYIAALGKPAIRYLGSISYGMYVWQSFIISTGASRRLIHDPWLAFITVMLLAALSWHFIERPLAGLRHRIRPRAAATAARVDA
jgi:peptidoglycan/LPS O-acetylase OafA/YrhL